MPPDPLKNIAIILVGTKYPGNLGSAARAMRNMGLEQLRLAAPLCSITEESYRLARGGGEILSAARTYRSLRTALRGIHLVIGTTGKTGGYRDGVLPPRTLASEILKVARKQRVGIVFGPEDTGLVDDDLLRCQLLARIPTDPSAPSINLAQAVMIVCYEIFVTRWSARPARSPRLAPVRQVEAMYEQFQEALLKIGFLHSQNARHMMFALRRLLGRAGLQPSDVGMLRGIARQIHWYSKAAPGRKE